MNTWHIHIQGQVQGVGFRPFVFTLAQQYGLKGWVNNTMDGVHIVFNADEDLALKFMEKIIQNPPRLSKITAIQRYQTEQKFFENFQIIHSKKEGKQNLLLTPDFALCKDCRKELYQIENKRYHYPFITCTNCGPRYSIIHQLPYDRIHTTMETFQMCPTCCQEYNSPLDRRYYSQTNSCSDCGITLTLFDAAQGVVSKDSKTIIAQVIDHWSAGKIVAIKGIGGYLLTCDAANKTAVLELRKRKHRPSKPFALMYPTLSSLNGFSIDKKVAQELENHIAPIVLLEPHEHTKVLPEIAPNLNRIGIMLPYTPLFDLLLHRFDRAIVATSANISNAPIIYQDEKAVKELAKIADFILVNNREVVVPQDDSVVQYSFFQKQKIILRRSRGLAPTYINTNLNLPSENVLAMGAALKSTFSISQHGQAYISQYLGDLDNFDTQQNYQHTIRHFAQLLNFHPEVIVVDKHPEYASRQYGEQLSNDGNIPIQAYQHHIAHFGAIIGEHHLMHTEHPILGVIWDGTGLGDDGQIWGGEFFTYEKYGFSRYAHFDYFSSILGDKMPKEPRISALSACWNITGAEDFLKEKFSKTEWQVYHKILEQKKPLQTSSVGRIFDATASLLGLMDTQTYEGEAAMRLEALASNYFRQHGLDFSSSYFQEDTHPHRIPTQSLMSNILLDLKAGKARDFIAAKFHFSLIKLIKTVANNLKIRHLAFSGGVFQNSILVDLAYHYLQQDFELYFHQQLSPNDENISFGQLVCYEIEKQKELFNPSCG